MNIKDKIILGICKHVCVRAEHIEVLSITAVLLLAWLMVAPPAFADPPDNYGGLTQIEAFTNQANAEAFVKRLEDTGKIAFIVEKIVNGKKFYSVVIDTKPSEIIKEALREKALSIVEVQKPSDMDKGKSLPLVIPTRDGAPGPSISMLSGTTIYSLPEPDAAPLGTYSSLGSAQYSSRHERFHVIWLTLIEREGYVRDDDVKVAEFSGHSEPPLLKILTNNENVEEKRPPIKLVLTPDSANLTNSIEITTETVFFEAPSLKAKPIGTYVSLGNGVYTNFSNGFYGVWFGSKFIYGYVPSESVREVEFIPDTPQN